MEFVKKEETSEKSIVKILAVDDREDNLLSIETILEKENYTIVKANSGRAALKVLLQEHDFTLILMDVQMPDMNGFETASLIYEREKLRHIPIIFITAHNQGEERMFEGYKMGGVDFIYKPINPELLRYKVSVFVELYQKTHELLNHERKLLTANRRLEKEVEERKLKEEKIRLLNEQLLENNIQLKSTIEELDRFAYEVTKNHYQYLQKFSCPVILINAASSTCRPLHFAGGWQRALLGRQQHFRLESEATAFNVIHGTRGAGRAHGGHAHRQE